MPPKTLLRAAVLVAVMSLLGACASGAARPAASTPYAAAGITGAALIAAGAANPAPVVSGTLRPYQIAGRWYHPTPDPRYDETGLASWYGDAFNGRPTATGEIFDMYALTAAHKTLPLPALVEVTSLDTGRSAILRVNDRGPFVDGRIIDLSRGAAQELGILGQGLGRVRVRYVGPAPRLEGRSVRHASASPGTATAAPYVPAPAAAASPAAVPYAAPAPYTAPVAAPAIVAPVLQPSPPAIIPLPLGAPALPSAPPAPAGDYWVQAGSFASRANAEAAARALGDRTRIETVQTAAGIFYRVSIGPLDDPLQAERARTAAVALGYGDAFVVSRP